MISLSDFERPFEHDDYDAKVTHTLAYIEFSGDEELIGKDVTLVSYVFNPNYPSKSLFSIKTKDQEGTVNLGALEFLLTSDEYDDLLGILHDTCSDFVGEETDERYKGLKFVFDTEEWTEPYYETREREFRKI